jgi:hypothetical protein
MIYRRIKGFLVTSQKAILAQKLNSITDGVYDDCIKAILVMSFSLIAVMALISPYNAHPDEHLHFSVAHYYYTHWLPPKIGFPEARFTYSKYGYSYINSPGIDYILMGKFDRLLGPLIGSEFVAARLFNVVLYLLLIFIAFRRMRADKYAGMIFIPLLLSPQVWYVFSYVNNDAFAFFLMMLTASEMTFTKSAFFRFLARPEPNGLWGGISVGIILGLLLLSKQNFYVYILFMSFFMACLLWNMVGEGGNNLLEKLRSAFTTHKAVAARFLLVASVALFVAGLRYVYDISANGFDSKVKISAYKEQIADYAFRDSTMKHNPTHSNFGLKLKSRGFSYGQMFSLWQWGDLSFKSFVGVYGWMRFFSPETYYTIMRVLYILFFLFIAAAVLKAKDGETYLLFLAAMLLSIAAIAGSSYHSWVSDFQAQGRYLFPILGMVGLLLQQTGGFLRKDVILFLVMVASALSAYSYILIAMPNLVR